MKADRRDRIGWRIVALGKKGSVVMLPEGKCATPVERVEEGAELPADAGSVADSQSAIRSTPPDSPDARHEPLVYLARIWILRQ